MLFYSQYFLIFISAVVVWVWESSGQRVRHSILLVSSLIFYSFWSVPLISLLVISSILDFYCGKRASISGHKKWVYLSVSTNLGILGYFKYVNFGIQTFTDAFHILGVEISGHTLEIVLPLGISFYTFQSMSYTIDMYRRKYTPCDSFLRFALYVSFFPQLVAGPIVRANEFLGQLTRPRRLRWSYINQGLTLFIIGAFKKIVVADQSSAFANAVFGSPTEFTSFLALIGVLAFSFQIYFDFSAYTDMARGLGYLFGYKLPINFLHPYTAVGIRDFWRRWHITLSRWLRDYLYISLGGSRRGPGRTVLNVMLTMLLGGLWHGASWNFVIWGGLHGVALSIENLVSGKRSLRTSSSTINIFIGISTFCFITLSWIFFRAEDLNNAKDIFVAISTVPGGSYFHQAAYFGSQYWLLGIVLPSLILIVSAIKPVDKTLREYPLFLNLVGLITMGIITLMVGGGANEFIYFQF